MCIVSTAADLVVPGDDDDTDAGTATFLDGVDDLLARWIQHADDSDERAVRLHTQNTHHSYTYTRHTRQMLWHCLNFERAKLTQSYFNKCIGPRREGTKRTLAAMGHCWLIIAVLALDKLTNCGRDGQTDRYKTVALRLCSNSISMISSICCGLWG